MSGYPTRRKPRSLLARVERAAAVVQRVELLALLRAEFPSLLDAEVADMADGFLRWDPADPVGAARAALAWVKSMSGEERLDYLLQEVEAG